MRNVIVLAAVSLLAWGCEEDEPVETKVEKATPAAEAPAEAEKPEAKMAAEPAEGKEADEPKAAGEEAKKEEAPADPLTECCRALGREGFNKRSQEYMAASKACGTAMTDKKSVTQALPSIKKELKTEALPSECKSK